MGVTISLSTDKCSSIQLVMYIVATMLWFACGTKF